MKSDLTVVTKLYPDVLFIIIHLTYLYHFLNL